MGNISWHMLQHIALMNALAPAAMLALRSAGVSVSPRHWPFATVLQLALIWGWHAPPLYDAAMSSHLLMTAMHVTLTLSACWFWLSVFSLDSSRKWEGIVAILVTGKLFCLLGALLAFAPRLLYETACARPDCVGAATGSALADQQYAGSLMLIACPMSYVLIGTVMAARWFLDLERQAGRG